ncbi:MAG: flavin reductase family protein [Muribaculaceae bacterium]|nr:flavin reductase family protein [Muribaculaceae bacterium]
MRKNFGSKPWCYPQPVFILAAYDKDGEPNAMNVAWGGIFYDDQIAMCISANHKTTANILESKAFTVSMADKAHLVGCDYVGIVSGNKVKDKFKKAGFTHVKSEFVNAPIINELPMTLECKLVSYDPEKCTLIGEIVNVSSDESILDENGKIDPAKLQPITFDPVHNTYLAIGEKVGKAFGDGLKLR